MSSSINVPAEAEKAYRDAMARLRLVRTAWTKAGKPLIGRGAAGQEVPHPLWTMLQQAEAFAAKPRIEVRRRHAGPDPSAVVQASIGPSPAARLRPVK